MGYSTHRNTAARLLATLLMAAAGLASASADDSDRSTATINVSGISGGRCRWLVEALPISPLGADTHKDTIVMRDGAFSYTVGGDSLYKVFFTPELRDDSGNSDGNASFYKTIELYMEKGSRLTVNATLADDYMAYTVSGSPLNATYAERLSAHRKAHAARLNTIMEAMMPAGTDSTEFARLNEEYSAICEKYRSDNVEYARRHPNEQVSAAYLVDIGVDSLLAVEAEKLAPDVRNGQFKPVIDTAIKLHTIGNAVRDNKSNVRIGVKAPAFSYTAIDGRKVSHDMFAGKKYLVLDFWGSWCAWCLRGAPKMREYRNKYSDRLEILGVDCEDKPERMKAAIEKHGMDWLHIVNDTSSIDSNMTVKYAVQAFPTKIVISPEGKIVNYTEGEEESFYEEIDKLMR